MAWDGVDRRGGTNATNTRDLVVETHTRLNTLCDYIMDNGQPGAISKLNTLVVDIDTRVQSLEGWKKWVNGVGATLGAIAAFVMAVWKYVFIVKIGKGD